MWTTIVLGVAIVYCVARAIEDGLRKRYVWSVLGAVAVVALLTTPIPSHTVKVDLPAAPGK